MSKAIAVSQKDWQQSVLDAETPVVVDFWAPWCGPCRAVAPILEDLATEYDGKVQIVKVNVDEEPMLSGQYGVQAIPTMIVFKNGKEIERVIGARGKNDLRTSFNQAIAK
jgi:thioredoxin 1